MIYDDIVLGSGLSALGTLLGLDSRRRVLVLAGPDAGTLSYYTSQKVVPCAVLGCGGLGNFWHGVIPTSMGANFGAAQDDEFAEMFERFYPHAALRDHLRKPRFFVPWRPIRPARELAGLSRTRSASLTIVPQIAARFSRGAQTVDVVTTEGLQLCARRLWIACGSLHTPPLLERSLGAGLSRGFASDHIVSYVGQVRDIATPQVHRTRDGVFFPVTYGNSGESAYTTRPARFGFRKLDYGIEQRAVFGMPTGSAVAKIMRRLSPGLLAEAFYNRAGLFPAATDYSVYAQTIVRDAYELRAGELPLLAREALIAAAGQRSREQAPFASLKASQRADLYIPGIHLHNTVNRAAMLDADINRADSAVQIVDPSVVEDIGPDHHSFKVLMHAYRRAKAAGDQIAC